ncbi:MAG: class I SAM-dependent methyltransferase [Gemmatimonadales bacterium]
MVALAVASHRVRGGGGRPDTPSGHGPDSAPATLLELGAGGGSLAYHLKRHFRLTLTDVAPAMLAVSQALDPKCEHLLGDMRSLRLGRQFDVVLIHDAIMYAGRELRPWNTVRIVRCPAPRDGPTP